MSEEFIKEKKLEEVKKQAKEHADWFADVVMEMQKEVVRITAETMFIHGYYHRIRDEEERRKTLP